MEDKKVSNLIRLIKQYSNAEKIDIIQDIVNDVKHKVEHSKLQADSINNEQTRRLDLLEVLMEELTRRVKTLENLKEKSDDGLLNEIKKLDEKLKLTEELYRKSLDEIRAEMKPISEAAITARTIAKASVGLIGFIGSLIGVLKMLNIF